MARCIFKLKDKEIWMSTENALKRLGLLHLKDNPKELDKALDEILARGESYIRHIRLRRQTEEQKQLKQK
jgi:vacuolar-type H+-ATPase subunit H